MSGNYHWQQEAQPRVLMLSMGHNPGNIMRAELADLGRRAVNHDANVFPARVMTPSEDRT